MAFSVVYTNGSLECEHVVAESLALQFPESLQALCPGCDVVLLTDVNPKVLQAMGSEFTVRDTQFGGGVATKWTITDWAAHRQTMCRFDIHHKVTVTFGFYSTLYSLENDLPLLLQQPMYSQHFVCIMIPRSLNWQTMVQVCSHVLQIQYPSYRACHCKAQDNIVLMGWQRGSAVAHSELMQVYNCLHLHTPMPTSACNIVSTFNSFPVYILQFVMKHKSRLQQQKSWRLWKPIQAPSRLPSPPSPPSLECKIDIAPEPEEKNTVSTPEEEDWVLTVIYADD